MEPQMLKLTWQDIENLGDLLPYRHPEGKAMPQKVYGIPRGGAIVAGLFYPPAQIANTPEEAFFFVDDIIDSGATQKEYAERFPKKDFVALFTKPNSFNFFNDRGLDFGTNAGFNIWVHFPWEEEADKDLGDTVIRQLQFIGENASREGLKDTPRRVIKALKELTSGYAMDPHAILTGALFSEKFDEMVIVKQIPFWSLCEHHMLPFHGTVSVAYIPEGKIVGLSKIPRVVEAFSRRLQVQERLTVEIAHSIEKALGTQSVAVHIEGYHTCMAMRGVRSSGNMVTNCLLGRFKESDATRAEFLSEIRK